MCFSRKEASRWTHTAENCILTDKEGNGGEGGKERGEEGGEERGEECARDWEALSPCQLTSSFIFLD